MKKETLVFLLLLINVILVRAQYFNEGLDAYCWFINPTESDGIILATVNGGFQFDGYEMNKLNLGEYSDANIQSKIYKTSNDEYWFAIYQGIVQVVGDSTKLHQIQTDHSKLVSDYHIFDYSGNEFWVLQDNQVYTFNIESNFFSKKNLEVSGRRVKKYQLAKGELFLSYFFTTQPVVYLQNKGEVESPPELIKWKNWPKGVTANNVFFSNGRIFYATKNGVVQGDLNQQKVTPIPIDNYSKSKSNILSLLELPEDNWLINIQNVGVLLCNRFENKISFQECLLSFEDFGVIHSMEKDGLGNLFFSTSKEGLVHFNLNNRRFKNFPFSSSFDPSKIFMDSNGYVWSGNLANGSKVYKKNKFTSSFVDEYNQYSNLPLERSKFNYVFGQHLFLVDDQNNCFYVDLKNDNSVGKSLLQKVHGVYEKGKDQFWISTTNGEIYEYSVQYGKLKLFYSNEQHTRAFNYIGSLPNETYFAHYNNEQIVFFKELATAEIDTVVGLNLELKDYFADDGFLWITSDRGLFAINIKNKKVIPQFEIYPELGTYITALYPVDNDFLLASNTSIIKFNPYDSLLVTFSEKDGYCPSRYIGAEINDNLGNVFFAHKDGLLQILKNEVKPQGYDIPVHLTQLIINDTEEYPLEPENLNFDHTSNTLSFAFNAIDFAGPNDIQLKYRMTNYEEDWVAAKSPKEFVRYAKLPPGTYTFEISAANAFGHWNEKPFQLPITISPPFWQTWWFRLLALAALGLIAYRSFRTYVGQKLRRKNLLLREQRLIIEKKEAVENERSRIAAEMHDDLGGGLTTIKFLSQKALKNIKDEKQAKDIGKIGKYSTQLVQNLSEIIWAMNGQFDSLEGLLAYVRNYAHEFLEDNQMELNFPYLENIPKQSISGEKRRNVFLVIKEALNNAVRHSGADQVRIVVRCEKELIIRIMDNGTGLPDNIREHGNGLSNMTKRMQRIGGNCTFKPMDGLCVELTLPLSKN